MNCRTSSYAPRFLAVAAIAALVVAFSAVPANAQGLNFAGGFSSGQLCAPPPATQPTGCVINVTAAAMAANNSSVTGTAPSVPASTTELQLTPPNAFNQSNAAWFNTQQPIAGGFGVEFQFRISLGGTGDGFAFVIQNSTSPANNSGLAAVGGWGGGMGYGTHETDTVGNCPNDPTDSTTAAQTSATPCAAATTDLGIANSVAIEFDTFRNLYDPDKNHVAIQSCGTLPNSPDHDSSCLIAKSESFGSLPINLADGSPHYVQIVYLPYSATCAVTPCYNLFVYIDPAVNPAAVVQAHVDLNDPCNTGSQTPSGCPSGTILYGGKTAWVGFTAATGGATEEADILNFTFTPSVTRPLQGSGVTNSFVFPFATYNVTYPADVSINSATTTMTITPTVLPPADCNARVDSQSAFAGNDPTCTIFGPTAGNDAVIFDVACAQGTVQTQGDALPPSPTVACPTTTGFNPLNPPGNGNFHSSEDVSNILVFPVTGGFPAGFAPQFLTASEGTNGWVPIGVGFDTDCCTKGGGTSNYQSQMVAADFPGGNSSPFAILYQFKGFTSPVNAPAINSAQAGQTIPFKWQLLYPTNSTLGFNGGPVTNLSLVLTGSVPTTYPFLTLDIVAECTSTSSSSDTTVPVDTESQNGLVNQGNGFYQYNWQTPKSLANQCVVVDAEVGDGQPHEANIQFHK